MLCSMVVPVYEQDSGQPRPSVLHVLRVEDFFTVIIHLECDHETGAELVVAHHYETLLSGE